MKRHEAAFGPLVVLAVLAVALLTGLTTHRSHLRDLQIKERVLVACVHTDRSAADCRAIWKGIQ